MIPANEPPEGLPDAAPLRRELVGRVWMDSGQLVLSDPDYLPDLDAEALAKLTTLRQRFAVFNEGQAMVFRSGIRNASYPVYVTRFENGAIAKIEIELTEQVVK